MKTKSHSRSPDKKNFSVALPIVLIEQLKKIAKEETRSRNGQIELFLKESVDRWISEKAPPVKMLSSLESPKIKKPDRAK